MLKRFKFARIQDIEAEATFLRKWGFIGILIGVAAGLGALALMWTIQAVTRFLLGSMIGYVPPLPGGEGGGAAYSFDMSRRWLLPLVTTATGLAGGFLVWKLAPEAAGIGTNAAIAAFHANQKLKFRTSILKLLTSALTIGGGLTSGREGPIAQIGATTGATIADLLKLTARERNIALAAGLGAGIAAIFKAPLAGAIIGAEIFYKEDFEVEALVPGLIASVIGYSVVCSVTGFQPVFTAPAALLEFHQPLSLCFFAIFGLCCGLLARVLFAVFFRMERLFRTLPLWLATGLGGLGAGLLGLAVPSVLGTGYGWAQFAIDGNVALLSPWMLLGAAFGELLSMTFTLASGNSGGAFGPCVVTGGMFGGAFGHAATFLFPSLDLKPGSFAIVGMMAFFAAAAKAPVSTIVMISEMTGGYALLAPAMFAVVTAFVISGRGTIFPAQVPSRLDSPFHADEFEPIVLRRFTAQDVMIPSPVFVRSDSPVADAVALIENCGLSGLPVICDGRLCGRVSLLDVRRVPEEQRPKVPVKEVMSTDSPVALPNEDLFVILKRFAAKDVSNLPVVNADKRDIPIGLVTQTGLWSALEKAKELRGTQAKVE